MRWAVCAVAVMVAATAREMRADATLVDPGPTLRALERDKDALLDRMRALGAKLLTNRCQLNHETDEVKRNDLMRDIEILKDERNAEQVQLNELNEQLRQRGQLQVAEAFGGGECDLYMAEPAGMTITGVRLVGVLNVGGRQMLQFSKKQDGTRWTADPQRIAAARVTAPAEGARGAKAEEKR